MEDYLFYIVFVFTVLFFTTANIVFKKFFQKRDFLYLSIILLAVSIVSLYMFLFGFTKWTIGGVYTTVSGFYLLISSIPAFVISYTIGYFYEKKKRS